MVNLSKITEDNWALFLAYDQGLEHGPIDFNDENVDPQYVLKLARDGKYNGIILQKGVAEKYYTNSSYRDQVPLILKLNGKTSFIKDDPFSPLICTVVEALELGASAVGYTVYMGSQRQDEMFRELGDIVREAHKSNLPVLGWMYPRGSAIKEETPEITAYAARAGLELGADIVKVKFHPKLADLQDIVKASGRTKVVFSGGPKLPEQDFIKMIRLIKDSGALGMAVGRNIWQSPDALKITAEVKQILSGS